MKQSWGSSVGIAMAVVGWIVGGFVLWGLGSSSGDGNVWYGWLGLGMVAVFVVVFVVGIVAWIVEMARHW